MLFLLMFHNHLRGILEVVLAPELLLFQLNDARALSVNQGRASGNMTFFEWYVKPKREQIDDLIERIDEAMIKIGCMYTITTE